MPASFLFVRTPRRGVNALAERAFFPGLSVLLTGPVPHAKELSWF